MDIPKGTQAIEYVGERLKNDDAEQRGIDLADETDRTGDASVFNFVLDDKHMLDGNQDYNLARFINHSCEPNCYVDVIKKRIWIIALRDIAEDEELTYDYGFEVEHWKEHACRCGSDSCVGYIVSQEQWPALKKLVKKEAKKMTKKKRIKRSKSQKKRK